MALNNGIDSCTTRTYANVVQHGQYMLTIAPPICERLSIFLTVFTLVAVIYTADHHEKLLDRIGKLRMLSERSVKESFCRCWGFQGCENESASMSQLLSHYSSIAHETQFGLTTGIDAASLLFAFHKPYQELVPPNSTGPNSPERRQYCEVAYFELDEVCQKFISAIHQIARSVRSRTCWPPIAIQTGTRTM